MIHFPFFPIYILSQEYQVNTFNQGGENNLRGGNVRTKVKEIDIMIASGS